MTDINRQLNELAGIIQRLHDSGDTEAMRALAEMHPQIAAYIARLKGTSDSNNQSSDHTGIPSDGFSTIDFDLSKTPEFPGYEVIGLIGGGGMGLVYQARQLSLNRFVALKTIRGELLASDQNMRRFRQEAESVAQLQHANIVHVYDVGMVAATPFIAMEFVAGGTLAKRLAKSRVAPQAAAQLLAVLADAVHHAHERGIIHRDLKPSNILMTVDGLPKIADFGLAKWVSASSTLSRSVHIAGTPQYMSPEQASGRSKDIGPASDIFALGAIFYEMLVGHPPFQGGDFFEILDAVRNETPTRPRLIDPDIPGEIEAICLRCLAKTVDERFRSASELADAIRTAITELGSLKSPVKSIRIQVVSGDVTNFPCDILALKYANGLHGAAGSVFRALETDYDALAENLTSVGSSIFVESHLRVGAREVAFVATPPLDEFWYNDISRFIKHFLVSLEHQRKPCQHAATTLHGINLGLDEKEALGRLVIGIKDFLDHNPIQGLDSFSIVERDSDLAKRCQQYLADLFPKSGEGATRSKSPRQSALVVTPSGEEFRDSIHFGVRPALESVGLLCEVILADENAPDLSSLRKRVADAEILLIDLSVVHPLSIFVLGIARGLDRGIIVLSRDNRPNEFEPSNCLRLTYKSIRDLAENIKRLKVSGDR